MIKIQKILYMFFLLLLFAGCTPYSSLGESEGSLGPPVDLSLGELYCGVKNGKDINTISPSIDFLFEDLLQITKWQSQNGNLNILQVNSNNNGFLVTKNSITNKVTAYDLGTQSSKAINLSTLKATSDTVGELLLYDPNLKEVLATTSYPLKNLIIKDSLEKIKNLSITDSFKENFCVTYKGTDKKNYYIKMPVELIKNTVYLLS